MFMLLDQINEEVISNELQCFQTTTKDMSKLRHEIFEHLSHNMTKILQIRRRCMVSHNSFFCAHVFHNSMLKTSHVKLSFGKATNNLIPEKSTWRAKEVLELVHPDLCGPINPTSTSGKRYVPCFVDGHSMKASAYSLKEKLEAFSHFKLFKKSGLMLGVFKSPKTNDVV